MRRCLESIPATRAAALALQTDPDRSAPEHRLGSLSRGELGRRIDSGAVVLLPVGSLEQHGEHLPVATDSLLVEALCLRVAERARPERDVLVAPALWTGFSPHHLRFGATVSLSAETFLRLTGEVVRGLGAWAPRLLVVNGHGGNRGPLITLSLETGCPVVSYWEPAAAQIAAVFPGDASIGHAGEAETGMMLEAFPQLVGTPGSTFETPADAELLAPELGSSGVIGDPTAASATAGAAFLEAAATALLLHLDRVFPRLAKGA